MIKCADATLHPDDVAAVNDVMRQGRLSDGEMVRRFEDHIARHMGATYAVAVSNGTMALFIALRCYGIGNGDEVIVPAVTFFATAEAVMLAGATPIFADVQDDIPCISRASVSSRITSQTKAIIPVHLYGFHAPVEFSNDITIIEDCAQALDASPHKNTSCYSFYATKHITSGGEGGAIVTDNPIIYNRAKIIANHGLLGRRDHVCLGLNARMTEIQASIGISQLDRWRNDYGQKTRDITARLYQQLMDAKIKHIDLYPWNYYEYSTNWTMPVKSKLPKGATSIYVKMLRKSGLEVRYRYVDPIYSQRVCLDLSRQLPTICPNAEEIAGRIIGLPNHPRLTQNDINEIVRILKEVMV